MASPQNKEEDSKASAVPNSQELTHDEQTPQFAKDKEDDNNDSEDDRKPAAVSKKLTFDELTQQTQLDIEDKAVEFESLATREAQIEFILEFHGFKGMSTETVPSVSCLWLKKSKPLRLFDSQGHSACSFLSVNS